MLARLEDNDKCQEPWVPFLVTLKFIQMVQSSLLLCWKKMEGNEAWQAHWKGYRFLWTDRETKCCGKKRIIKETDKKASYGHSTLLHLQIVQMHP